MRILLVEDDEGTIETLEIGLRRFGHHDVVTAPDGTSGVRISLRERVDAALIDLRLPDGSGLEVIKALRAAQPSAQVYLLTAFYDADSITAAVKMGATFLPKSLDIDHLVDLLTPHPLGLSCPESAPSRTACGHPSVSLKHWATLVVKGATSDNDLRTVEAWGRTVGMARSTLELRCTAAGVLAKDSLMLTRLIRAFRLADESGDPRDFLDADPRTTNRMIALCGCERGPIAFLLAQQRIVSADASRAVQLEFLATVTR